MEPIQTIGMEQLDEFEKATFNKLANEYYHKIQRMIKNETGLVVHIKQHSKGGKRKMSQVLVKVLAPTRLFEAEDSDWELATALHRAFERIEKEIQHKFHTDDQRPGKYI